MADQKRVYILVKTYPTISEKYGELVCTAGILEDGRWIRLYPIPFRLLRDKNKYSKFTWITAEVTRNLKDFRPESYRLVNPDHIVVESKPQKVDWAHRRHILSKTKVYTNLDELIAEAKSEKRTSLALFKPTEILDIIVEPDSREWNQEKLEKHYAKSMQLNMFKTVEEQEAEFKLVDKIPYKFYYRFKDDSGKESKLMIEDWEVGMLYLRCLQLNNFDESIAIQRVKERYTNLALSRNVSFFLGTTLSHHLRSKNPFIIIGVYYPPKNEQLSIMDFLQE